MCPESEFTRNQVGRLQRLGKVMFTKDRNEIDLPELIYKAKDANILAFDPDNIGGFEKAADRLINLLDAMPKVKALALDTTAFGYVDLDYCRKRGIVVSNVPYYSTESVAEHTLAFLLGACKRIFLTDRRIQNDKYQLVQGFELKGKTLGVIGLGHIGTRVAELGMAIGMKVVAYNRTKKRVKGVKILTLNEVLRQADALSINLAENSETKGIISREKIKLMKQGMIVINAADRSLIDEKAMAKALKSDAVDSYVLEAEDLMSGPLAGIENAFLFRGFGWYTREALERNKEIWVENIIEASESNFENRVN
jgi:phosphoglycerate dehydrogenase-like enzyme